MIDKITATEFQTKLSDAITKRADTHDTAYGPIRDLVIGPVADVLESQNDRIRKVSDLLSLINVATFEDIDLDNLVANEGMIRNQGATAATTVTFSTAIRPAVDITVHQGYPLSSTSITFVVTEDVTLLGTNNNAGVYFNNATNLYELDVAVIAVTQGTEGNVGADRLIRPLRQMVTGFSAVTNKAAATGGSDIETNAELTERYLLAILGRQMNTSLGLERFIRDEYSSVEDVHIVHGTDTLLTRAATDAGAVDTYIIGDQILSSSENLTFIGIGQLIAITSVPLRNIISVTHTSGTTSVEGTDYEVVYDTSGNDSSTRAIEGIKFLAGSTSPAINAVVSITYTYNNLVRALQATLQEDGNLVLGRDVLVKEATKVNIRITATVTVESGFNATIVSTAVIAAITTLINAYELDDNVEASDIQQAVRNVTGVDNFVFSDLNRTTAAAGSLSVVDFTIQGNEYARIDTLDLILTVV